MNLRSRKGGVKDSRFYVLTFMALTKILGMVSPSDLALMAAQVQTIQKRKVEADRILNLGIQQFNVAAMQSFQQALTIYREIKDRHGEGASLGNLGLAYDSLGLYDKAIDCQLQSLAIADSIQPLYKFSKNKWYIDDLYEVVFVQGSRRLARQVLEVDSKIVDGVVNLAGFLTLVTGESLKYFENGKTQFYALVIFIGVLGFVIVSQV